jgi:hypothetical protein
MILVAGRLQTRTPTTSQVRPRPIALGCVVGCVVGCALGCVVGCAEESDIWRRIAGVPDFWTTLDPLEPGVVRGIQSLATRYHWDVFFVTQRPDSAGETTQRQTQRWLIQQGFELPTVIVMQGSRGCLADLLQLDVLVDDTRKHCVDVIAESKTKPMLVVRSGNTGTTTRAEGLGIHVVGSVREALITLRQLSVSPTRTSSMWQRLTRRAGRR